ncbi:UNVERIFIED_CONTAM: hypothetical protein K2H54_048882 [Gekko kuhli]
MVALYLDLTNRTKNGNEFFLFPVRGPSETYPLSYLKKAVRLFWSKWIQIRGFRSLGWKPEFRSSNEKATCTDRCFCTNTIYYNMMDHQPLQNTQNLNSGQHQAGYQKVVL